MPGHSRSGTDYKSAPTVYRSLQTGEIGGGIYSYRTMGIGVSLAAGFTLGSLPAATIGLGFVSGEMLYNGAKWWSGEMNKVLYEKLI